MNKIKLTVMLTLATSIISIPSVAAENIKLETLEGTIDTAQAFLNGTYVYEGSKKDDQEYSVYYSNGYDDTLIEDVYGTGSKYGTFYIDFEDDEVLFNLATGKVEEDNAEEKQFEIENKFRRNVVRKADRYKDAQEITFKEKLAKDIFGEVWYEYVLENANDDDDARKYNIYLSENGKYIDVSETLNIIHYTKDKTKIKIDSYDDLVKEGYKIENEKTLLMDTEYIYRIFTLTNINDSSDSAMYAQKISKEQGKTKKDAYRPKRVITYEMNDLAKELLKIMISEHSDIGTLIEDGKMTARMLNNSLYLILPKEDSITIKKYDLKTVKDDGISRKVLKLDEDFDNIEDMDIKDYSIDLYGNIWILNKGKISKIIDDELVTMYTTDRSMNKLSVFNDTSLVAWNTENEIYATVPKVELPADSKNEENNENETITSGWVQNLDNTWSFNDANGVKTTGWIKDNNIWYYLNNEGIMQTGWIKDTDGKWYYLYEKGSMAVNTTIDGYYVGSDGAWIE